MEVRPRPVSGVPAVKLPPGLEPRLRAAGAAEEAAEGAARPKLRDPAVPELTLAPLPKPPAAAAAGAGVDVAGARPNPPNAPTDPVAGAAIAGALAGAAPPKPNPPVAAGAPKPEVAAGAGAAAAGGGAREEVRPRDRETAGVVLGAENPPKPVVAEAAAGWNRNTEISGLFFYMEYYRWS